MTYKEVVEMMKTAGAVPAKDFQQHGGPSKYRFKPGQTVSHLYQRGDLGDKNVVSRKQAYKHFMKLNPKVKDINKVRTDKDYTVSPAKFNQ